MRWMMYLCGGCPPAPAAGQLPLFTRTPPRAKGEFRRIVEGVSTHPQAGCGAVMGKADDRLARSPTDGCTRGGKQAGCSVEREQGRRIKGVPKTAADRFGHVSKFVAGNEPDSTCLAGPARPPPADFDVDTNFGKHNPLSKQGRGPGGWQVRERTGLSDSSSDRKHQCPHEQHQGMMVNDEQVRSLRAAHAANSAALEQREPIMVDSDSSPGSNFMSSKRSKRRRHIQPPAAQQPAACAAQAPLPISPFLTPSLVLQHPLFSALSPITRQCDLSLPPHETLPVFAMLHRHRRTPNWRTICARPSRKS